MIAGALAQASFFTANPLTKKAITYQLSLDARAAALHDFFNFLARGG
jgi:hypothetical protein